MNNTPSERFVKALDYLKETRAIRAFKDILEGSEYQPSTISEIRAGRQEPNDWILQTLQEKYRISKEWIIRGAGEMRLVSGGRMENDVIPTSNILGHDDYDQMEQIMTRWKRQLENTHPSDKFYKGIAADSQVSVIANLMRRVDGLEDFLGLTE